MMDEYMKKYREQMDNVTLSETADQAIWNDLQKSNTQHTVTPMRRVKRNISAAMVAAAILVASSVTVFAGVVIHEIIIKSNKTMSEEWKQMTRIELGESYYYDLLAGDTNELYALTDNDYNRSLTEHHVVVWKSADQGDTWEATLFQPDELKEGYSLSAGDLRNGEAGIEAVVILNDEKAEAEYIRRVYRIAADSYTELDMKEVFTQLGNQENLWNVKYVNSHIIALVGTEECVLYDMDTAKVVKNLPFNLTMGCLKTQDQFLLYGKEIYTCLNAETLEEQEPEEGLQEFVKMMYEKNNNDVLPPMAEYNDTLVCATRAGIYEYRAGEITHIRQLTRTVNEGNAFNGLLPMCKTQDGTYYIATFRGIAMSIWQIDGDKEELK